MGKFHEVDTVLASVFQTVPPDSPYALELLVDTLSRLAPVSSPETAAHVRRVIERIQVHITESKQAAEQSQ